MLEAREGTGVGDVVLAPQLPDDPHQLFAHLDSFGGIVAKNFVFVLLDGVVGTAVAYAEIDSAAAEPIDSANHVSHQNRIPEGSEIHRRAQTNSAGASADRRKRGECVQARFCDDAVADPNRVKAERLSSFGDLVNAARFSPAG
jgi:hypothetical protein